MRLLEGQKVRLRWVEDADLQRGKRWMDEAEVSALVGRMLDTAWRDSRGGQGGEGRGFGAPSRPPVTFGENNVFAIETDDGRHIGFCDLRNVSWINRKGEVGIVLEMESRGKGYGPDALRVLCRLAFNHLGLNKLYYYADAENIAAQKSGEECGFKVEGRLEAHTYLAGGYHDAVLMGLLAATFRENERALEAKLAEATPVVEPRR